MCIHAVQDYKLEYWFLKFLWVYCLCVARLLFLLCWCPCKLFVSGPVKRSQLRILHEREKVTNNDLDEFKMALSHTHASVSLPSNLDAKTVYELLKNMRDEVLLQFHFQYDLNNPIKDIWPLHTLICWLYVFLISHPLFVNWFLTSCFSSSVIFLQDCELLYLNDRPEKLMVTSILVPPTAIRPSVFVDGGDQR